MKDVNMISLLLFAFGCRCWCELWKYRYRCRRYNINKNCLSYFGILSSFKMKSIDLFGNVNYVNHIRFSRLGLRFRSDYLLGIFIIVSKDNPVNVWVLFNILFSFVFVQCKWQIQFIFSKFYFVVVFFARLPSMEINN